MAALHALRYTPVAIGGLWAALIVPPLWVKACVRGAIVSTPACAILAASAGIVLAGWLGATSGTTSAVTSSATSGTTGPTGGGLPSSPLREGGVTHVLALLVLLSALPIVCLLPSYLRLGSVLRPCGSVPRPQQPRVAACRPYQFDPTVATVGFALCRCPLQ